MDILIYTMEGCDRCDHMKELCDRAGLEYRTSHALFKDVDTSYKEMVEMYPNFKMTGYPFIIIDGKEIGGIFEAARFFLKEGLVSVPK